MRHILGNSDTIQPCRKVQYVTPVRIGGKKTVTTVGVKPKTVQKRRKFTITSNRAPEAMQHEIEETYDTVGGDSYEEGY